MVWQDLLFAHWRVPADALRSRIPEPLALDTFQGEAWLAVVPFRMSGVRPRGLPSIPPFSRFPELNVRTYVEHEGRKGVWFFSLDAADRLAVRVARRAFHLPYFDARMELQTEASTGEADWVRYRSSRTHRGAPSAEFHARYRPTSEVFESTTGSLEEFLTERYSLFAADAGGRVFRGDVDHAPWPLQRAECEIKTCDMTRLCGFELPLGTAPHLLFARGLDVWARWPFRIA